MFKKKPNIPPRPKPPITEQLLDDLKNAPEGDIVFTRSKTANESQRTSTNALESASTIQIDSDDLNDSEIVFQKVRTFVEMNSNLQTIMSTLQTQNEALLSSDLEMKKLAEDIRRQALEALK